MALFSIPNFGRVAPQAAQKQQPGAGLSIASPRGFGFNALRCGLSITIPHAFWRITLLVLLLCCSNSIFAQPNQKTEQEEVAPYEQNTAMPSFSIRLLDSVTTFNTANIAKGKPTVFILFSPDCDHCAQLARQVKDSAEALSFANIYMVSPPGSFFEIKKFAFITGIAHKKSLVVGEDYRFFFGSFFHAATVPFVVVYNKNKKLFRAFKALKNLEELQAELNKLPE